jgi:hypothetical protein
MIPKNIDEKTLELLNDLQTDFDISFEIKDIDYCEVFQKSNTATIYYNPKIVNSESIAHELLHIWLNRFNYSIGNHIFLSTQSNKKLSKFLNKFLCDYIGNCCDHYKMYPKYLEMGYSPKEFLKNGLELKTSITDIKKIKLKFLGFYNSQSVNLFIGCLFSILADHIKENDYYEHHKYFIEKDSKLYSIVVDFWNKWEVFDIENIDPIYNSDLELSDNFIDGLTDWTNNKTFI